jgi:RNA recognition motif-containing protein
MNIYVGNLPYSVRDDELRAFFAKFGAVRSAQVILDKRNRRSRGYGFVDMVNDEDALKAIAALDGKEFHGRALRVQQSNVKGETTDRPGRDKNKAGGRKAVAPRGTRAAPKAGGLIGFIKRLFG